MLISEILLLLKKNHYDFFSLVQNMPNDLYKSSVMEKWSPHQHLEHIKKAVQPLVLAYKLPKFILRTGIGKSNRPSKTYTALIESYQIKLRNGGKASGRFIPKEKGMSKKMLIFKTNSYVNKIMKAVSRKWTEAELDIYIFPHPLMGKITAREMLYFTAYHVQHHKELVEKYYLN